MRTYRFYHPTARYSLTISARNRYEAVVKASVIAPELRARIPATSRRSRLQRRFLLK